MIPVHIKITSVNFPLKIRTFWSAIIYFVTTFLLKCWSIIQIECIITALGVDRFSNKFAYCCVLVWRHYRNESGFETHILTNNMTILYQNDLFCLQNSSPCCCHGNGSAITNFILSFGVMFPLSEKVYFIKIDQYKPKLWIFEHSIPFQQIFTFSH